MATSNITVLGGGEISAKDIAIAQANGGLTVFETTKDIYVTSVTEQITNQRINKEFTTTVENVTKANTVINNSPGGAGFGQVQFYVPPSGAIGASFGAIPELHFDYNSLTGVGTYLLSSRGGYYTSIGDFTAASGNVHAPSGLVSANTLSIANVSTLAAVSVSGVANFSNTVNVDANFTVTGTSDLYGNTIIGNVGTTVRNLTVTGNVTANNANLGNLATANYFKGAFEADSNIQPNIKSVANTLVIGNVEVFGNSNSAIIRTLDSGASGNLEALSIGVNSQADSANYYLVINNKGNITLPTTNLGVSVVKSGVDILFQSDTANFKFHPNGYSDLGNTALANFFQGQFNIPSNAQPNITSLGNLVALQVGNTSSTANITLYGNMLGSDTITSANLGNSSTYGNVLANFANFANANIGGNINITSYINTHDLLANGNITINGNLFVQGNTNYVNVENLNVKDPIISMGGEANGTASITDGDRGLLLLELTANKFMGWQQTAGQFAVAEDASVSGNTVTINTYGNIKANNFIGNLVGSVVGNLVNGNSSVNVAANGNVVISATGNATLTVTGTGANVTGTMNISGNTTAGDLVTANNFTGNLVNGTSNIVITASGNVTVGSAGNAGVLVVTGSGANITGTANITGNVVAPNFIGKLANGAQTSVSIPTADGNIEFSSASNTSFKVTGVGANVVGKLDVTTDLTAGNLIGPLTTASGTSSVVVAANSDITLTSQGNATLVVTDIDASVTGNLNISDTVTTANFTVTSAFAVGDGTTGTLNSNGTTFNLVNTTATTINFGGAATTLNIGASTGTVTIKNPTVVGTQTTQNLFNTVATTLNIGGAATALNLGATSGTTTINNDLSVNGGDILSNQTTLNIANTTSTTLNIGGAATALNLGATTGTLTVNNPVVVGTQTTQNLFNTVATTLNIGGAADINLSVVNKTTNIAGNLNVMGLTTISADGNLNILGGDANGQYLKLANVSNGQSQWSNVNWSDLGTNDASRGPTGIALGKSSATSTDAVFIGENAGTGGGKVAIGKNAGTASLPGSQSVEINGKGDTLTPNSSVAASGFYVRPIRALAGGDGTNYSASLRYDTTTGEIVSTTEGATSATTAGTVTAAAQANITSLGTLTGLGVNGTITAVNITANTGTITGDGGGLSNIPTANLSSSVNDKISITVTNNGIALNAANVGTLDLTINGTTYTLYMVPKP